ncbi:hypothetical protein K474DRAFT_1246004 [Panus rudis PR-1116 ss-1]|nr:hypothetical protein K474DRAFT_1246004 [Panus rudis PR-1116 ss-1]
MATNICRIFPLFLRFRSRGFIHFQMFRNEAVVMSSHLQLSITASSPLVAIVRLHYDEVARDFRPAWKSRDYARAASLRGISFNFLAYFQFCAFVLRSHRDCRTVRYTLGACVAAGNDPSLAGVSDCTAHEWIGAEVGDIYVCCHPAGVGA